LGSSESSEQRTVSSMSSDSEQSNLGSSKSSEQQTVSSVKAGSFYVAEVLSSKQATTNAFKHDKGTRNFRTCGDK